MLMIIFKLLKEILLATLARIWQTLFHAIDDVFCPLHPAANPHRTEPISVNKLCQGNASWSTCKMVLGWLIDTDAAIITLPLQHLEHL